MLTKKLGGGSTQVPPRPVRGGGSTEPPVKGGGSTDF